jgi:outer membrane protein TolC
VKARWWCAPALMAALAGPLLQAQVPAPISLTLTDAERIALSNSEALRIQGLRIQSASRRYTLGIRDYLPQLELAFAASNGVNVGALDTPSNQLSVSLREPIYNGGRTAMQRSLSRLELILSRHASAVARADVLNDAWDKYHQVLVLQAQKAVKQDALRQMRKQLEIAQTERGIGMIREIDLLDVELSVSNQEMDLESTESDLEQAFYALKRSLGMSPDQTVALVGSIDSSYQGIRIDKPSSWFFSVAQENNADLQSANYKVTQMEAQVAMTRAQFLPQIGATVSLLVSGPGFPLQTPGFSVGLDISFPQSIAPVKGSGAGSMTGLSASTSTTSLTADPLQSVTGFLDTIDAELALQEARAAVRDLTRDLRFQVGQLITGYRRQNTTIGLGRRSLDIEQKKIRVLLQQVQDGSATRSDLLKEQTQTAALEVQVLSDILVLIREERALEKLIGVEPGGLVRLVGGDHEGS